jgi:hypothetical protein
VSRACWVLAVSLAACSHPSKPANPGCCDTSGSFDAAARSCCYEPDAGSAEAPAVGVSRENATAEVASAAVVEERFAQWEGCARELRVKGPIERNVAELGRLCAQGMTTVGDAVRATEPLGGAVETSFAVGARPTCFRVGAVASAGDLSLSLAGPHGERLANVRSNDKVALLPSEGPYCVREPGTYRAAARLIADAPDGGDVILQVWHSGREP